MMRCRTDGRTKEKEVPLWRETRERRESRAVFSGDVAARRSPTLPEGTLFPVRLSLSLSLSLSGFVCRSDRQMRMISSARGIVMVVSFHPLTPSLPPSRPFCSCFEKVYFPSPYRRNSPVRRQTRQAFLLAIWSTGDGPLEKRRGPRPPFSLSLSLSLSPSV